MHWLGLLELRAVGVAALLGLLLCAAPAPARAQAANADAAYRKLVDDAVREFSAEHWEEARALFKRAHALSPNARTLRGMGMTAFELRMYVQALRELDAALREPNKPLAGELRAQVEQIVQQARDFVGRVTLSSEPPAAKLLIDGKEQPLEPGGVVLLDPGTHVVSASLEGYKSTNLRISVEGGADQTVRVALEPLFALGAVPALDPLHPPRPIEPTPALEPAALPPPAPPPPAPQSSSSLGTAAWIALGAGAAFGAGAAALWLVGNDRYNELQSSCGSRCSAREIADSGVVDLDTLTTVSLAVALTGGATSAVLFAIHAGSDDEAPTIEAGLSGVALRGKF